MALAKERQGKEIEQRAKMDEEQKKKMEILREEERAKEELKGLEENFRIKEELVKKEAHMIAFIKHEDQDRHIFRDEFPVSPLTETDSKALLEKFLDDQSASVSNVKVSVSGQLPFIPAPWTPICQPKESITSPADKCKMWPNCAFHDKSVKFGTKLEHIPTNVFSDRAIADLSRDPSCVHLRSDVIKSVFFLLFVWCFPQRI